MDENIRIVVGKKSEEIYCTDIVKYDEDSSFDIRIIPFISNGTVFFQVKSRYYENFVKTDEEDILDDTSLSSKKIGGRNIKKYRIDSQKFIDIYRTINTLTSLEKHNGWMDEKYEKIHFMVNFIENERLFDGVPLDYMKNFNEFIKEYKSLEEVLKTQVFIDNMYSYPLDVFGNKIKPNDNLILAIHKKELKPNDRQDIGYEVMKFYKNSLKNNE